MFAAGSFTPTYSGPFKASGDTLRRARADAFGQGAFEANQRATRPMFQGVRAGSKMQQYGGGVLSDLASAKGAVEAANAYNQFYQNNAGANLAYQTAVADEMDSIRNLDLTGQRIAQQAELDLSGDEIAQRLRQRERQVGKKVARMARQSSVGGILSGLFRT